MKEFTIELGKIAASVAVAAFVAAIFFPAGLAIGYCVAEQVRDILPAKVSVEKGFDK